ncbi:hypothetical protein ACYOEI_18475, partial [Singulisphaera rosea]
AELTRLARRLNYDPSHLDASALAFSADADRHAVRTRAIFQQVIGDVAGINLNDAPTNGGESGKS